MAAVSSSADPCFGRRSLRQLDQLLVVGGIAELLDLDLTGDRGQRGPHGVVADRLLEADGHVGAAGEVDAERHAT